MAELDKEGFLAGMAGAKVDTAEEEPVAQIEIIDEETKKPENELDEYDETNLINDFKSKIGFDGDIEGSGLDALVFAANKQTEKYKAVAEDERVKAFLDFLDTGGTQEQFIQMQPTEIYSKVVLDEEDTELTENVVKEVLIVLRNYDDETEVDEFIDDLKDKGKLFEFAKAQLPKLQKFEETSNNERKAAIQAQVAQEKRDRDAYFSSINDAFKGNKLVGIAPDSNWAEVQRLSVPDEKGKIGINDILDNLDANEVATMNYVAYCLNKGIPFSFKPNGKEGTKTKPILSILDKGRAETKTPQAQGALGKALKEKINNN